MPIYASMIQVDQYEKKRMEKFYAGVDFRNVEHLIVLVNERRVKAMAQLE